MWIHEIFAKTYRIYKQHDILHGLYRWHGGVIIQTDKSGTIQQELSDRWRPINCKRDIKAAVH